MPRHPANFHSVAQVLWQNRVPMRLEPEKPLGSAQSSGLTQFEAPRTPRPTRKLSKSGSCSSGILPLIATGRRLLTRLRRGFQLSFQAYFVSFFPRIAWSWTWAETDRAH